MDHCHKLFRKQVDKSHQFPFKALKFCLRGTGFIYRSHGQQGCCLGSIQGCRGSSAKIPPFCAWGAVPASLTSPEGRAITLDRLFIPFQAVSVRHLSHSQHWATSNLEIHFPALLVLTMYLEIFTGPDIASWLSCCQHCPASPEFLSGLWEVTRPSCKAAARSSRMGLHSVPSSLLQSSEPPPFYASQISALGDP